MKNTPYLCLTLSLALPGILQANPDHFWNLDSVESDQLESVGGHLKLEDGVKGKSVVLDAKTILKIKHSEKLTHQVDGFTFVAWVNPYGLNFGQQMIVAKNVYSLNQREWGLMLDKDNKFRLYVWQNGWDTLAAKTPPTPRHWHHLVVAAKEDAVELWLNGMRQGKMTLSKPIPNTEASMTLGAVDDNGRVWQNFHGALDEVQLFDRALSQEEIKALYFPVSQTHRLPKVVSPIHTTFPLWSGEQIPGNPNDIPFVEGVEHRTIHRPTDDQHKFLHGAAIIEHKGVFYANWANSPTNENGPHETLQGRRSKDGGKTWNELEVIGPGFDGADRHSHGVLFVHKGELWTICSRFGVGEPNGRRFRGLKGEAFVLNEKTDKWVSLGIVMQNCWPYDEPVKMGDGNYITGGQDKDGYPVVAISRGDNFLKWDSVLIPFPSDLKPSFAETTVWAECNKVWAIIRGGGNVAWVSISEDHGKTWTQAQRSNFSMPRAKAYIGKLSTGQLYLLSNYRNRDTLAISVSKPGELTLSKMYRVRHGKSVPPRFPGHAKGKQWSYPYGYEHDGNLYVVYSVGKEDCGLSVIPINSLKNE